MPFKLIFKQDKWMTIMIFSLVHFDCILRSCHFEAPAITYIRVSLPAGRHFFVFSLGFFLVFLVFFCFLVETSAVALFFCFFIHLLLFYWPAQRCCRAASASIFCFGKIISSSLRLRGQWIRKSLTMFFFAFCVFLIRTGIYMYISSLHFHPGRPARVK